MFMKKMTITTIAFAPRNKLAPRYKLFRSGRNFQYTFLYKTPVHSAVSERAMLTCCRLSFWSPGGGKSLPQRGAGGCVRPCQPPLAKAQGRPLDSVIHRGLGFESMKVQRTRSNGCTIVRTSVVKYGTTLYSCPGAYKV